VSVALAVFVISAAVCAYLYAGYPALLWVVSRLRPRPPRTAAVEPMVSVVVPVYNEAAVLADKLENTLALDYPRARLEVIVVSDGSTDASVEIARRYAERGVEVVELPRGGKGLALNAGAARATGEILVLTDANGMLEPGSLRRLVEPFADPEVGGVCGHKRYRVTRGADTTELGENLYWRFDSWQKRLESRIGSVFAADGTLYALRRELYVPLVELAQADDIAISARVPLQGKRLVYAPDAVVWEEAPVEGREELRRKVRVTNHSVRALVGLGSPLWTSGFYSLELLSHKLLRHLAPFFLLPLFASSAVLAARGGFWVAPFAAQALFCLLALAGFALRRRELGRARPLAIPYYFTLVNAAALLGVLSILRGERRREWTPRQGLDSASRRNE
jgi:cellulose synthase/poly-beta-1,6-N-acetylglucosamine synthase-like glycosyltransferase